MTQINIFLIDKSSSSLQATNSTLSLNNEGQSNLQVGRRNFTEIFRFRMVRKTYTRKKAKTQNFKRSSADAQKKSSKTYQSGKASKTQLEEKEVIDAK